MTAINFEFQQPALPHDGSTASSYMEYISHQHLYYFFGFFVYNQHTSSIFVRDNKAYKQECVPQSQQLFSLANPRSGRHIKRHADVNAAVSKKFLKDVC